MNYKTNAAVKKIKNACLIVSGLCAATWASCLITSFVKKQEIYNLANQNGYQQANAIYLQSQYEKFEEQLNLNIITPQEFNSKILKVESLPLEYYLSSDSVSTQIKEEYAILKNAEKTCEYVNTAVGCVLLADVICAGCAAIKFTRKEQAENKLYQQMANNAEVSW